MADEWIKARKALLKHPKTVRMASALSTDRFRIVGGLFAVWSLFDTFTEDGRLEGYTPEAIDGEAWPGFADAMAAVEWLLVDPAGVTMPDFDSHNGQSAKRRAEDAERKRRDRARPDKLRTEVGPDKRRVEKKEQRALGQRADRFDEFWSVFPSRPGTVKANKTGCRKKWAARGLDMLADVILADVSARVRLDRQWKEGYSPNPETYINQSRWDDGFSATVPQAASASAADPPTRGAIARHKLAEAEKWAAQQLTLEADPAEVAAHLGRMQARYGEEAKQS